MRAESPAPMPAAGAVAQLPVPAGAAVRGAGGDARHPGWRAATPAPPLRAEPRMRGKTFSQTHHLAQTGSPGLIVIGSSRPALRNSLWIVIGSSRPALRNSLWMALDSPTEAVCAHGLPDQPRTSSLLVGSGAGHLRGGWQACMTVRPAQGLPSVVASLKLQNWNQRREQLVQHCSSAGPSSKRAGRARAAQAYNCTCNGQISTFCEAAGPHSAQSHTIQR